MQTKKTGKVIRAYKNILKKLKGHKEICDILNS